MGKLYRDILTGDEMFVDTSKHEIISDAFYMVVGKHITMSEGNIELAGSNPSAEEAAEGCDENVQSGIDVVLHQRLQETQFGTKKDYLAYMKEYMKNLTKKLNEEGKTDSVAKLKSIQGPLVEILKNFKDLQFFTGESQDPDGMVVLLDYKEVDGEEKPVLYFPMYGLEELKLRKVHLTYSIILTSRAISSDHVGLFKIKYHCLIKKKPPFKKKKKKKKKKS